MKGSAATIDLRDVQSGVLGTRPSSYVGCYLVLRVEEAHDGRAFLRRCLPFVSTAVGQGDLRGNECVNLAVTFKGLQALGLPQSSLDSFPEAFRQGMAARAEGILGDTGESAPACWDNPFATGDVHLVLSLVATSAGKLDQVIAQACRACGDLPGISLIYRLDAAQLSSGCTHFGFRDGISQPSSDSGELSGQPYQGAMPGRSSLLLGYPSESGQVSPMPQPAALGHNGTFMAFRKLHEQVAYFRRFLRANSASPADEELLAAKMVGRWRSGAPLALCPQHDDKDLGADPERNNDFKYADDPSGFKCPRGAHIRRANPRDSIAETSLADVTLHRCLRRGTSYGPPLPADALEDDGVDRGIVFIFLGSSIERQYEFVRSQWQNDGEFAGLGAETDPLVGSNDGNGTFTIPQRPVRRRLRNMSRFTITRGGEYCFVPSLTALRWLASLE